MYSKSYEASIRMSVITDELDRWNDLIGRKTLQLYLRGHDILFSPMWGTMRFNDVKYVLWLMEAVYLLSRTAGRLRLVSFKLFSMWRVMFDIQILTTW